jgi:hypothetical protein
MIDKTIFEQPIFEQAAGLIARFHAIGITLVPAAHGELGILLNRDAPEDDLPPADAHGQCHLGGPAGGHDGASAGPAGRPTRPRPGPLHGRSALVLGGRLRTERDLLPSACT